MNPADVRLFRDAAFPCRISSSASALLPPSDRSGEPRRRRTFRTGAGATALAEHTEARKKRYLHTMIKFPCSCRWQPDRPAGVHARGRASAEGFTLVGTKATPYQEYLVKWNAVHQHFLVDPLDVIEGMIHVPTRPGLAMGSTRTRSRPDRSILPSEKRTGGDLAAGPSFLPALERG